MERVELLLLLLILILSLYSLRVESKAGLLAGKRQGGCSVDEKEALLNFKQNLSNPRLLLSNWDISKDCCTWKGVGCSNTTGHVIKLDLRWPHMEYYERVSFNVASLIPSLLRLQHLQYLRLNGFVFMHISIPQSFFSLTNLHYLDLSNSGCFEEKNSYQLGNLTNLRHLDFSYSSCIDSIPSNIGNLINLRYLSFSYSGLSGAIPPHIGNLTNLQHLDLHRTYLAASNLLWISRLSSLQYLDMSYVNLTLATNWLHEIKVLPSLSILILQYCNLQTLPTLLTYLNFSSTINSFDLSKNQFQNSIIPSWIYNMTNLVELFLKDCQLQGPILNNSLGSLYKLINLDLSFNLIYGSIPQWIGNLSNLKSLSLAENQLSGPIPHSIGQLINLNFLDLSNNLLQGCLSNIHFVNLSQLKDLNLSNNHLDFNMTSLNWVPPFQLYSLQLRSCLIGPHFPIWIKSQIFLTTLDISNSGISDFIPSWFTNFFSQVKYLNMSHNTIRGELHMSLNITSYNVFIDVSSNLLEGHLPQPTSYTTFALFSNNKFSKGIEWYLNANMSSLQTLDLSQNHLYGEIPDSICQMTSIVQLDLSKNYLSGEIPKCKGNISSLMRLSAIHLTDNNLCGSIPHWIRNLPWLMSLHLSNNNFQGDLSFLGYDNELIILDLAQNKFTGNLSFLGDRLLHLRILRLRSNNFYGSIPSNLSKLKRLQILDLADNFLSGTLPISFKLLSSMATPNKVFEPIAPLGLYTPDSVKIIIKGVEQEYKEILSLVIIMDLSCNNLTGKIPTELMNLFGLRSLNLSKNQFIGNIPNKIGFMENLESLDLSNNHFSGEIPDNILKLSKLSYLNLSYNQLSGRIPMGTQLDTFNESSYFGNPKLCGKPLFKTCEEDEHNIHNEGINDDDDDDFGLFLGMGLGFAVGLWSVLGILLLKRSWAIAYFQLYHNITDYIYVFVVVKVNRWFHR